MVAALDRRIVCGSERMKNNVQCVVEQRTYNHSERVDNDLWLKSERRQSSRGSMGILSVKNVFLWLQETSVTTYIERQNQEEYFYSQWEPHTCHCSA